MAIIVPCANVFSFLLCCKPIVTFFSQQTEPHAITHPQTNAKANSQSNTNPNPQSNTSSNAYSKSFLFFVCFQ